MFNIGNRMKKLTYKNVGIDLNEANFKYSPNDKNLNTEFFLFQEEPLNQIKYAIENPAFFQHFVICGPEGSGKRTGIINLLSNKYSTKINVPKLYYIKSNHSIVENTTGEYIEGATPLFDPNCKTTPIVYEPSPTIMGLLGIPEHGHYYPGSLVKANGGYLILPISKLVNDFSIYETLGSCLENNYIDFKKLPEMNFYQKYDRTLPHIPVSVRVILIGEDYQYEQLVKKDNEIDQLFTMKIELDFEAELNKTNIQRFSALIDSLHQKGYPIANTKAKKRLLEEALRLNESKTHFSMAMSSIKSLLYESMTIAKQKKEMNDLDIEMGHNNIESRNSLTKSKYYNDLKNGVYALELSGKRIGRINALSIYSNSSDSRQEYGQVNLISARVFIGSGNFLNIQREINLSGDIHDKGVFILQSYLKGLFFNSFGLDASLVFEQNHSIVDGDSASIAELVTILSALSEIEIPTNVAVTGSLAQYGEVLPVGAINLKIETWYKVTQMIGSKNTIYKVFIPAANEKDILLNSETKNAIKSGKFEVHSVSHVNEVISAILDVPLGQIEKNGTYTKGTLLHKIESRFDNKKKPKANEK